VVFKIIAISKLNPEQLLQQLPTKVGMDYYTLKMLYEFYNRSLTSSYKNLANLILRNTDSTTTFKFTPHAILFFLSSTLIPNLDSGGSGSGSRSLYNNPDLLYTISSKDVKNADPYFKVEYEYEKTFTIPFIRWHAIINNPYYYRTVSVMYFHPDIYYTFNFFAEKNCNITVFDENNQELLWIQYTGTELEEIQQAEDSEKSQKLLWLNVCYIIGLSLIGITSVVLSSLVSIYGAVIAVGITLLWNIQYNEAKTKISEHYSHLNDILDSAKAENDNYGWLVYTYRHTSYSDELWCTSGKWYWHDPDLKKGEKWWIKLGSVLNI